MMHDMMMDGGIMIWGMGLIGLLVTLALVALVKYVFFR